MSMEGHIDHVGLRELLRGIPGDVASALPATDAALTLAIETSKELRFDRKVFLGTEVGKALDFLADAKKGSQILSGLEVNSRLGTKEASSFYLYLLMRNHGRVAISFEELANEEAKLRKVLAEIEVDANILTQLSQERFLDGLLEPAGELAKMLHWFTTMYTEMVRSLLPHVAKRPN